MSSFDLAAKVGVVVFIPASSKAGSIFFLVLQALAASACSRPMQQHRVKSAEKVVSESAERQTVSDTRRLVVVSSPPGPDGVYAFDAELDGKLVLRDGCVVVESLDNDRWSIPVWPFGTRFSSNAVETKTDGRVWKIELGSTVFLGGGEVARDVVERMAEVGNCFGRFFLVGGIESVASLELSSDRIQANSEGSPHVATRYVEDGPETEFPAALIRGVLVEREGCIRIDSSYGDSSFILLWPRGTRFFRDSQSVNFPPGVEEGTLRLGDLVELGGGIIPESHARKMGDLGPCSGDVWLVRNVK